MSENGFHARDWDAGDLAVSMQLILNAKTQRRKGAEGLKALRAGLGNPGLFPSINIASSRLCAFALNCFLHGYGLARIFHSCFEQNAKGALKRQGQMTLGPAFEKPRPAGLETGDTAGLETCATELCHVFAGFTMKYPC